MFLLTSQPVTSRRKELMNRILKIPVLLLPLLLLSCALFRSDIDTVTDLLPRDTDLSGWSIKTASVEYSGRKIANYDKSYKKTGIEKLSACEYGSTDMEDVSVKVELMRFDSVLNAYGFFSIRRGEGNFSAGTVNEFYSDFYAVAQRGEYIVNVYSKNSRESMKNALAGFLQISLQYIGENYSRQELPSEIKILDGSVKYGIIYSPAGISNPDKIDRIYYTSWIVDKRKITVFASKRDSFAESYALLKNKIQKGYIISEAGAEHTAFIREPDGTYSFISVKNNWIYGCISVIDFKTGEIITDELRERITPFTR